LVPTNIIHFFTDFFDSVKKFGKIPVLIGILTIFSRRFEWNMYHGGDREPQTTGWFIRIANAFIPAACSFILF